MFLLLIAIIIAVVVVLSIQNAMPVAITFFFWKFEASLAIVIFLSFVAGLIMAGIGFSASSLRNYFRKKAAGAKEKEGGDG